MIYNLAPGYKPDLLCLIISELVLFAPEPPDQPIPPGEAENCEEPKHGIKNSGQLLLGDDMKRLFISRSILVPYLLILIVAFSRLAHPHSLIPIFSSLLFFGASRPVREFGIVVLGLIGLDIFIATHHYGYKLSPDQILTWIWYLLAVNLGAAALRQRISMRRIIGPSLLITVSFYVVSSFAIWVEWYPKTLSDLTACYAAVFPFFRVSTLIELLNTLLLFALARCSQTLLMGFRLKAVCA